MASRFEAVTQGVYDMFREVKAEHFPELRNAGILILFDKKKRQSGGKIVLGRIQKANELIRKLTDHEIEDGYDYIMYLDKKAWEHSADEDRIRLLRHELRHTFVDFDSSTTPYKLQGHTIEDFHEEVELNRDDPRWRDRMAEVVFSVYEAGD